MKGSNCTRQDVDLLGEEEPLLRLKERTCKLLSTSIPFNFKDSLEKGAILAAVSDSKI